MTASASCRIRFALLEACSSGIGRGRRATEEGEEGKIKRTGVRELADRQRSRNLCLHIGF